MFVQFLNSWQHLLKSINSLHRMRTCHWFMVKSSHWGIMAPPPERGTLRRSQESHHRQHSCSVLGPESLAVRHRCLRHCGELHCSGSAVVPALGTPWRASVGLWRNGSHGSCKTRSNTRWLGRRTPLKEESKDWSSVVSCHVNWCLHCIKYSFEGYCGRK